ncbi:MAG: sigma-54 dependent transcriptional regulator [Proteobacteria bacterium]|nr:sigma-54 dependent transcriptional regulator [Pseudomonadota bacterium]
MMGDDNQETTQLSMDGSDWQVASPAYESIAIPTLTIVYHPELCRIGDRMFLGELLAGREARISRNEPVFTSPGQSRGAALTESHLSRRPICLRMSERGGVVVDVGETRTRVAIDEQRVINSHEVSAEQMKRGAVLELASRLLLLLHWHTPLHDRETDDMGLIGHSTAIAHVRDEIRQVADLDVTVLIRGETGVGKELVATAIHNVSSRRDMPSVSVNLAAIPPSLAAAELFGATRGAFTGASRDQDGYFRCADGGTLFLDEIGEIPIDIQIMFLRVLETGELYPLGAQRAETIDTRVVAATDADLEALVGEGRFRAPLVHRLTGYEIWIPPLRERRDDIGRLLMYFLAIDLADMGEAERLDHTQSAPWLPISVMKRLVHCDWPGNVRQLRNVARQLVIGNRGRPAATLTPQLERQLGEQKSGFGVNIAQGDKKPFEGEPEQDTTDSDPPARRKPADIPEQELVDTLRSHRWDLKATARALGISRTSLYNLIKSSKRIRTAGSISAAEITECYRECDGDLDAMAARLEVSRHALRRRAHELGLV